MEWGIVPFIFEVTRLVRGGRGREGGEGAGRLGAALPTALGQHVGKT